MIWEIKYRYALNDEGIIVDVEDLTESERQDYECVSCGQILRPVLGKKRRKHFRHQVAVDCSEETYLHQTGKHLFFRQYQQCLETTTSFSVEFFQPRTCDFCTDSGPCQLSPQMKQYDLTRSFQEITLEKLDGSFVPDLLLASKSGQKLYVEIAVTHLSTQSKRESGYRIIEISIDSEDDFTLIESKLLSEKDERVEFINFQVSELEVDFSNDCSKEVCVFILWPSGKGILERFKAVDFERDRRRSRWYHTLVFDADSDTFVAELEKAHLNGRMVKNCFLCRYHAKASQRQRARGDDLPIFCKFLKESHDSNHAADCRYYRIDRNVFRFRKTG